MKKRITYFILTAVILTGALSPYNLIKTETVEIQKTDTRIVSQNQRYLAGSLHLEKNEANAQILSGIRQIGSKGYKFVKKNKWAGTALKWTAIGVGGYTLKGQVEGGLVNILQTLTFFASNLAGMIGSMLDYFLFYTISSENYKLPFIEIGWEILRDFTNIVFIFALLSAAVKLVLGAKVQSAKQSILSTILIALLVNFSLFFTWLVIDSSNLLAHSIYTNIEAPSGLFTAPLESSSFEGIETNIESSQQNEKSNIKSISSELISSLSLESYSDAATENIKLGTGGQVVVYGFLLVIMVMVIKVFFSLMLTLLGRTIGLFVIAITGPLAFASITIGKQDLPWIGFNQWLRQLFSLAFMAPIFIFFVYIIIIFSYMPFYIPNGPGIINLLIHVAVPLAGILAFLMLAQKITKDMSGKLGNLVVDGIGKGVGGALAGAGLAATGIAATAGLGFRAFGRLSDTKLGRKYGGSKEMRERLSQRGKKLMSFKADVTKIPGFSGLVGEGAAKTIGKYTGTSVRGLEQKAKLGFRKFEEDTIKDGSYYKQEAEYEDTMRKTKGSADSWQDKIEEARASGRLKEEERKDLKVPRDELAQGMKERTDARNDDSIKTTIDGTDYNFKEQKRQTELLESILKETRTETAKKVAKGKMSEADAKIKVNGAQAAYDSYFEKTFEGKINKKEKEIEKTKNTIKNKVAGEFTDSVAKKVLRGDITSKDSSGDKDTSK